MLLAALVFSPSAQAERPRIYAIHGATIVPSPGVVIDNGTVVLRDGLIERVGAGLKSPSDAVEIDGSDLWVYPGLIDAWSRLTPGATEREPGAGGGRTPPASPRGLAHPVDRIRPERRAGELLQPFEGDRKREMEQLRELGFAAVVVAPGDGILRGRGAVIQLAEEDSVPRLVLRDEAAQIGSFEYGGFGQAYPTSLMGAVAALRQTLLDAQRHATWTRRYRLHPEGMQRPVPYAAYAALAPLLDGTQPLFWSVDHPEDAILVHGLARPFGLRVVVAGSGHEWEIAGRVAATGMPLLHPVAFPDKPDVDDASTALEVSRRTLRRYVDAAAAPARLREAGVKIALVTRGLKNTGDFRKNLRRMIESGLAEDAALAALTTVPAELLGLERMLGTLETGKIANLIVAGGPLFDEDTELRSVFVDGRRYEIEKPDRPESDPDAVVDPRGTWSVAFELGSRTVQREWTISGERGSYSGTAETASGEVRFATVTLEGNALTVTYPAREGRGEREVTVVIEGDGFEGVTEMGPRSVALRGSRVSGPEGER